MSKSNHAIRGYDVQTPDAGCGVHHDYYNEKDCPDDSSLPDGATVNPCYIYITPPILKNKYLAIDLSIIEGVDYL